MGNLAVFNWSGGKDSALALHYVLTEKVFDIHCLLTTVNENCNSIAMHGIRERLLIAQTESLGLPLQQVRVPEMPDMEIYEEAMDLHFRNFKAKGVTNAIFGDIFLEDLKKYRELQFEKIGINTLFPLWKKDSLSLVKEFISLGYKTIVVCARADLKDFCGRVIDQNFIDDLPAGVDPCGENGEFHTFVFDGPIFSAPIRFTLGALIYKSYPSVEGASYWHIDLLPG